MRYVVRMLPGVLGATAAFIALKILLSLGFGSLLEQAALFYFVYVLITAAAEHAMSVYGRTS